MTASARRSLLLWLLAMLAGAAIVWHSRFTADMSFFLPSKPTPEQQVLVNQLKEGAVARLLMVAISGGDDKQRAALSHDLRGRLAKMPEFASVQNGESDSQTADRDFLLKHRYLLAPNIRPERFTVDGLESAISNSIDLLASPAGMMLKPFLTRDPTGELVDILSQLNASAQPDSRAGVWSSRDGERAMLLIQTRALGSDTDGQEAAIALVRQQFAASREASGVSDASLTLSGPGLFAVNSRATIKDEIAQLSLISSIAIIGVLFFVYRSFRLLTLGLLPVISGALAGVVAVSLAYGTVFGITVGFGSALIGEAVDYSIYYFVQSSRMGVDAWRERFWPTIRLGVLSSVAGFAALLFSGFPGLAQLGLYSLAGVLTAALVTRFVLPQLAGGNLRRRDLTPLGCWLERRIKQLQTLRWPALALALFAAGTLYLERDQLWNPQLSALSTVTQADQQVDTAMRADIAAQDSHALVVVTAADRESALQMAERIGTRLDELVLKGLIGGYDSPTRFLPSLATQSQRRASLPSPEELAPRLRAALSNSPLAAGKLDAFLADVELARHQADVTPESLTGTSLALAVDAMLLKHEQGWSVLLPLRPAQPGSSIDPAAVRAVLNGDAAGQALFIDMSSEFGKLYNDYLHEAMQLSLAGFVAIVLLLAVTLRSLRRLGSVLLPLVLAVIIVIAGQHLIGERLHLLHLIGMLLVVAVGSNYALFFDQGGNADGPDPETLASMLVANLTTAIGFGTLGLSSVPVLHSIGLTVGPGAVLALFLAAIFAPRSSPR